MRLHSAIALTSVVGLAGPSRADRTLPFEGRILRRRDP